MAEKHESPEFEALIMARDALREAALDHEGDSDFMAGAENQKWELYPAKLRREHARCAAMRALANRLELEAQALYQRTHRKRLKGRLW